MSIWDKEGNLSAKSLALMAMCTIFTVGFIAVSLYEFLKGLM